MRVAHFNLKRSSYPFTLEFFDVRDHAGDELLLRIEVKGPGPLYIPPVAAQVGSPVWIRMTFADGTVQEQWPA